MFQFLIIYFFSPYSHICIYQRGTKHRQQEGQVAHWANTINCHGLNTLAIRLWIACEKWGNLAANMHVQSSGIHTGSGYLFGDLVLRGAVCDAKQMD